MTITKEGGSLLQFIENKIYFLKTCALGCAVRMSSYSLSPLILLPDTIQRICTISFISKEILWLSDKFAENLQANLIKLP
jgi:hypothetical protein